MPDALDPLAMQLKHNYSQERGSLGSVRLPGDPLNMAGRLWLLLLSFGLHYCRPKDLQRRKTP